MQTKLSRTIFLNGNGDCMSQVGSFEKNEELSIFSTQSQDFISRNMQYFADMKTKILEICLKEKF